MPDGTVTSNYPPEWKKALGIGAGPVARTDWICLSPLLRILQARMNL